MKTAEELTIQKSVVVPLDVERAFELFTEGMAEWWPLPTHSIAGEEAEAAFFEGRVGGRVYERSRKGEEASWATVVAWEPPHRFILEWTVNPTKPATELEVRFTPDGDGTRVGLEHRGWEQYGDDAAEERSNYDGGWDFVLGKYADSVRS